MALRDEGASGERYSVRTVGASGDRVIVDGATGDEVPRTRTKDAAGLRVIAAAWNRGEPEPYMGRRPDGVS